MGSVAVEYSLLQPFYICPSNGEIDGKVSNSYLFFYLPTFYFYTHTSQKVALLASETHRESFRERVLWISMYKLMTIYRPKLVYGILDTNEALD